MEGRPLEEKELIERAAQGDVEAFTGLLRAHQGVALRIAYLVVRDRTEAEDVTQEAFLKAFRAMPTFRVGSAFRPWLLAIVRNEGLNRVRGRNRRERLRLRMVSEVVSGDAAPSPETAVLAADARKRLLEAVERLAPRFRDVVVHRYLAGLSEEETATLLGIPRGTVKSRAARGLTRLQGLLEEAER